MSVFRPRLCSSCGMRLVHPTPSASEPARVAWAAAGVREAHCELPSCTWCNRCVGDRLAAGREAGG